MNVRPVNDGRAASHDPAGTVLVGPASLDRYVEEGRVLPGGGALNMAYHWAALGMPFTFVSRVGADGPEVFAPFLARHGIHTLPSLEAPGADAQSAAIDIVIRADRQPWMDHFVEGVWAGFRLTAAEEAVVAAAQHVHFVLVDAVVDDVLRLGPAGVLDGPEVAADFLSFRHFDLDRFERVMPWVQVGFVGWPGEASDPMVAAIGEVALRLGRLLVVTLGGDGMRVFDGRAGVPAEGRVRVVPITRVEVAGTTVGCGDSFIAAFLERWWASDSAGLGAAARLDAALGAGAAAGARATEWLRPLPDAAYEPA